MDEEAQSLQQLLNYGSSRLRAAMTAWCTYVDIDEHSILAVERMTPESRNWWKRNIGYEIVSTLNILGYFDS